MKHKIKCTGCNKVIAKGQLPALVEIQCPHCSTLNDLSHVDISTAKDHTQPFSERLKLEKK